MRKTAKYLSLIIAISVLCLTLAACGKKEEKPGFTYTVGDVEISMNTDVDSFASDGVANFIGLFEALGLEEGQRDLMPEIQRYMATSGDLSAKVRLIQEQPRDDGNFEFYTLKFVTSDGTDYVFTFTPGTSEDLSINIPLADDVENRMIPRDAFIIYCYAAEQIAAHPESLDVTPFEGHLDGNEYKF